MSEDERTNEQIVTAAIWEDFPESWPETHAATVVEALTKAGRLVTPEHDAKVLRDAAEAIRAASPPTNSELSMQGGAGPFVDKGMEAYMEGWRDAFDTVRTFADEVEKGSDRG